MRQFKERTRKVKEVTSIVCNKCGRVIPVVEGVPQEDVLTVDKRWGYFRKKITGEIILTFVNPVMMN